MRIVIEPHPNFQAARATRLCRLACFTMAASIETQQTVVDWNEQCTDIHLALIGRSIVDWREIAPFLGLTEAEEIAILGSNPHSVPAQKMAMLRKWRQKKGVEATYNQLYQLFGMYELTSLQDKMKQIIGGKLPAGMMTIIKLIMHICVCCS